MTEAAVNHIRTVDPAFSLIIDAAGPYDPRPPLGDAFAALLRSIVYQQLAGRAAAAIHGRVLELMDGPPSPKTLLSLTEAQLRSAGLSGSKTAALIDLATKCSDATLPIGRLHELDDEEIVENLCVVRGIGRWTAEMFLLFELRRIDVWPVDDFAVRKGYARLHGLDVVTPKELAVAGEPLRPYRSVAAWYCWRTMDTVLP